MSDVVVVTEQVAVVRVVNKPVNKVQVSSGPGPRGPKGDKGDPGAPGEPGPPGQDATPSIISVNITEAQESWVYQHNLNTYDLEVWTLGNDGYIKEGNVHFPDSNTVQVDFYYAESGTLKIRH